MMKSNDLEHLSGSSASFADQDDPLDTSYSQSHQSSNDAKSDVQSSKLTEIKEIEQMAKKETKNLRTWRLILLGVMLVTGIVVSIGTNRYLAQQERHESLQNYALFKQTVERASQKQGEDFKLAMSMMAETITVAGSKADRSFPFVRVPQFEVPATYARQLSTVEYVAWSPLVTEGERGDWAEFVAAEHGWYEESQNLAHFLANTEYDTNSTMRTSVWRGNRNVNGKVEVVPPSKTLFPIWQSSPPPHSALFTNFDVMSEMYVADMLPGIKERRSGAMTACDRAFAALPDTLFGDSFQNDFHGHVIAGEGFDQVDHPHSMFIQPVFADVNDKNSTMVGILSAVVAWDVFFGNLLPDKVKGMTAVLSNTCGQSYTYMLQGQMAKFLGVGDLHDAAYSYTSSTFHLVAPSDDESTTADEQCVYSMTLYYSKEFSSASGSQLAFICGIVAAAVFIGMTAVFCMYDRLVRRRNAKIIDSAARSNAILSSLFPKQVRDRLLAENESREPSGNRLKHAMESERLIGNDNGDGIVYKSKPIADLFPETTILFADIAGFTAWSSVREPSQVFMLLETLFHAFDDIAKKRRIFKVETVGDCYVAVVGLPDARKDHAVAMARFARDCMHRTRVLTRKLELSLGPETGDLAMRMGMHSGPVTAGVLRGARSRFQLFGDTMNTAARMESTGLHDKIQLSQETADLLAVAGKANWITKRDDTVFAKGKGEMQTYWLELSASGDASSVRDSTSVRSSNDETTNDLDDPVSAAPTQHDAKTLRLINWNVDVLLRLLKQIEAQRGAIPNVVSKQANLSHESRFSGVSGSNPLDEVKETVVLPNFKLEGMPEDPENVALDPAVVQQVFDYVSAIATMYQEHPFHNFAHASHVAMSVSKLLSRIVAPTDRGTKTTHDANAAAASMLHDHTYGITSDPLTQFGCVFSALIHDVEHPGVPNAQLVKEKANVAQIYTNRSVAEQNSVSVAWNLLLDAKFSELRRAIYTTDEELVRFRQIVVNAVMASDIVDKELKVLRNLRWDRAFSSTTPVDSDMINRKATIVIEHLIQASDVAHTMQHWQIYRKWNELFFKECYQAYVDCRADKDPTDGWYEGELGFFDFYIIPLAKKLKDCGVFGVSSDEYLNYATQNRQEWEKRGLDIVNEMRELVSGNVGVRRQPTNSKYFI